jgi:hypothetical protein
MRSSKKLVALFAVICAAAFTAVPVLGAADARKSPCPCPGQGAKHRQKTKSLVGKYKGTTEEGGTVSFRFTRSRKIVDFTLTKATLYCVTEYSTKIPTREPEYKKPLAKITHDGPIPMRGVSKRHPQGKEFSFAEPSNENVARQSGLFTGKVEDLLTVTPAGPIVLPAKGFIGEVEFETANGPTPFPSSQNPIPVWAPGTEWCVTKLIDWDAKKPGDRGYVP